MTLIKWLKYVKTINAVILIKLRKRHYTYFMLIFMFPNNSHLYCYTCFQTVSKDTSILII